MKLGMDKCNVMIMEMGKMKHNDGIKLPDVDVMKQKKMDTSIWEFTRRSD